MPKVHRNQPAPKPKSPTVHEHHGAETNDAAPNVPTKPVSWVPAPSRPQENSAGTPVAVDSRAAAESRARGKLAALGFSPQVGPGEAASLAQELVRRSSGRMGTDERFVYAALEFVHATNTVPALDQEVGKLLRAKDPGLDSKVRSTGKDAHLRFLIASELGGSEAQRATDFLETGKDRFSSSSLAYLEEGFTQKFDQIGDSFREHPLKTGAVLVGGVAVGVGAAVAAPAVVAAAGLGYLGYKVVSAVENGVDAAHAKSAEERAQKLVATGVSAAEVAMAAPALTGIGTVTGAVRSAAAAGSESGALAAARALVSHGSVLGKGATVAAAAHEAGEHAAHGHLAGTAGSAAGSQGLSTVGSLAGHALHNPGVGAAGSLGGHALHGDGHPPAPEPSDPHAGHATHPADPSPKPPAAPAHPGHDGGGGDNEHR